jgi:hypothetical protein
MIEVSVYQLKIIGIYGPYPGGYLEIEIFCEHIKTKIKQGNMLWLTKATKTHLTACLCWQIWLTTKTTRSSRHMSWQA